MGPETRNWELWELKADWGRLRLSALLTCLQAFVGSAVSGQPFLPLSAALLLEITSGHFCHRLMWEKNVRG